MATETTYEAAEIKEADLKEAEFSMREARDIVRDLFQPKPRVYWTDLLLTMAVGILCLRLLRRQPAFSPLQIVGYVGCVLAFYRAGSFTHELVHLRTGSFNAFRTVWNLLCGIPFLMPSFMYYPHIAHHAKTHYNTHDDGEYLPLASSPAWHIILYMANVVFIPIVAIVRFMLMTPLGWLSPSFRRFAQQHASTLVMDPRYIRPLPSNKELLNWRWQELGCFLLGWGMTAMLLTGLLELSYLLKIYLVAVAVVFLNQVRTLGAHRFLHRGEQLTVLQQLLDSVNHPDQRLTTGLWAPVGLRYHALHHLFPSMPYHSLREAHERLMAQLPADSPYRKTNSPSLFTTLRELWARARASSAG